MTFFAGLRGTGSFGTGERPQDFREMILWTNPNGKAPLFALTAKMKKEACDDPQIHWWEETNTIARATVNGAIADATTTTVVVDAAASGLGGALQFAPGDLLQVEEDVAAYTTEILKVAAVASDTSMTVVRGAAGSTAASFGDGIGLTQNRFGARGRKFVSDHGHQQPDQVHELHPDLQDALSADSYC